MEDMDEGRVSEALIIKGGVKDLVEYLICPISMTFFVDPVNGPCNHVFEREAIKTSLSKKEECPVCRHPMTLEDLHANLIVAQMVSMTRQKVEGGKNPEKEEVAVALPAASNKRPAERDTYSTLDMSTSQVLARSMAATSVTPRAKRRSVSPPRAHVVEETPDLDELLILHTDMKMVQKTAKIDATKVLLDDDVEYLIRISNNLPHFYCYYKHVVIFQLKGASFEQAADDAIDKFVKLFEAVYPKCKCEWHKIYSVTGYMGLVDQNILEKDSTAVIFIADFAEGSFPHETKFIIDVTPTISLPHKQFLSLGKRLMFYRHIEDCRDLNSAIFWLAYAILRTEIVADVICAAGAYDRGCVLPDAMLRRPCTWLSMREFLQHGKNDLADEVGTFKINPTEGVSVTRQTGIRIQPVDFDNNRIAWNKAVNSMRVAQTNVDNVANLRNLKIDLSNTRVCIKNVFASTSDDKFCALETDLSRLINKVNLCISGFETKDQTNVIRLHQLAAELLTIKVSATSQHFIHEDIWANTSYIDKKDVMLRFIKRFWSQAVIDTLPALEPVPRQCVIRDPGFPPKYRSAVGIFGTKYDCEWHNDKDGTYQIIRAHVSEKNTCRFYKDAVLFVDDSVYDRCFVQITMFVAFLEMLDIPVCIKNYDVWKTTQDASFEPELSRAKIMIVSDPSGFCKPPFSDNFPASNRAYVIVFPNAKLPDPPLWTPSNPSHMYYFGYAVSDASFSNMMLDVAAAIRTTQNVIHYDLGRDNRATFYTWSCRNPYVAIREYEWDLCGHVSSQRTDDLEIRFTSMETGTHSTNISRKASTMTSGRKFYVSILSKLASMIRSRLLVNRDATRCKDVEGYRSLANSLLQTWPNLYLCDRDTFEPMRKTLEGLQKASDAFHIRLHYQALQILTVIESQAFHSNVPISRMFGHHQSQAFKNIVALWENQIEVSSKASLKTEPVCKPKPNLIKPNSEEPGKALKWHTAFLTTGKHRLFRHVLRHQGEGNVCAYRQIQIFTSKKYALSDVDKEMDNFLKFINLVYPECSITFPAYPISNSDSAVATVFLFNHDTPTAFHIPSNSYMLEFGTHKQGGFYHDGFCDSILRDYSKFCFYRPVFTHAGTVMSDAFMHLAIAILTTSFGHVGIHTAPPSHNREFGDFNKPADQLIALRPNGYVCAGYWATESQWNIAAASQLTPPVFSVQSAANGMITQQFMVTVCSTDKSADDGVVYSQYVYEQMIALHLKFIKDTLEMSRIISIQPEHFKPVCKQWVFALQQELSRHQSLSADAWKPFQNLIEFVIQLHTMRFWSSPSEINRVMGAMLVSHTHQVAIGRFFACSKRYLDENSIMGKLQSAWTLTNRGEQYDNAGGSSWQNYGY